MSLIRLLGFLLTGIVLLAIAGGAALYYGVTMYDGDLPDFEQLADYKPPTVTRIYAGDGRLLDEYAREKRVFVPIDAIPDVVKHAFIAAEDQNFYTHPGIDVVAILRAAVTNIDNLASDRRPIGASTITQQVAKNFLLTNEVSIERKVKEALLSLRIERAFTKDHILELYLNEIYLGYGAYGVAAAALAYFDKSLDELTAEEAAYLAALPKAPNNYNPIRRADAAKARRDWVLSRMAEDGYISADEARAAEARPLVTRPRGGEDQARADYFVEEVRRDIAQRFGSDELYEGGLTVMTTVDPKLQALADTALRDGLVSYDRRHGYRGPVQSGVATDDIEAARKRLEDLGRDKPLVPGWRYALVTEAGGKAAKLIFADGAAGTLDLEAVKWARKYVSVDRRGPAIRAVDDVVSTGDIVVVAPADDPTEVAAEADRRAEDGEGPAPKAAAGALKLVQVPDVSGGLVAMNPHNGRVLAMTGGFNFAASEFNRVTQAQRQPGSAFKPFVYLSAFEHGWTPASIVQDAPLALDQGAGLGTWRPKNYSGRFYGPSTLRVGVEQSRNLMTVRLARDLGAESISEIARRLGIGDWPPYLSTALGAGETTLMRLATAYAMVVNGGRQIHPALVERIQDRDGKTIFRRDERPCEACSVPEWHPGLQPPVLPDTRDQVLNPLDAYQLVHVMEGVIQRGTGRRALSIGKPLAGKTGTTNDSFDAWFMGFSPDLVVGVYVGFDTPRSLGDNEQGASAALPIWIEFMKGALADAPATPFRTPSGIRLVRIDAKTGLLPGPDTATVITEAFKPGTEPTMVSGMQDDYGTYGDPGAGTGTGGTLPARPSNPYGGAAAPAPGGLY
ncbi:penicillin-binding protein 1A [Tistrella mobilis]|uniref:penicillin-binding protein 1A n=1 Tax=Tistrella mobilis TaxID=171437 RepID=UPI0035578FE0